MKRIRRILDPTDFSPVSAQVFGTAVRSAKARRAELLVTHVLTPGAPDMGDDQDASPNAYASIDRSALAQERLQLHALVARAKRRRMRATGLLLEGTPADEIVRTAKSKRVDLIVMGSRDRTGLAGLFFGSVTERVIATAPCPVLTLRDGTRVRVPSAPGSIRC
jgi:nucleotide-binding universal stress UspA family protein